MPHQGRHPNEYHDYVLYGMGQANDYAQGNIAMFLQKFAETKEKIIACPDMLYKNYWRNKK